MKFVLFNAHIGGCGYVFNFAEQREYESGILSLTVSESPAPETWLGKLSSEDLKEWRVGNRAGSPQDKQRRLYYVYQATRTSK